MNHLSFINFKIGTKSSSPNYNEYQFVQEYEYIQKAACSPLPKTILYTPIEPLNINNQVYYSFTSDSQEQFDIVQMMTLQLLTLYFQTNFFETMCCQNPTIHTFQMMNANINDNKRLTYRVIISISKTRN